jgi:hypothetical protein
VLLIVDSRLLVVMDVRDPARPVAESWLHGGFTSSQPTLDGRRLVLALGAGVAYVDLR